MTEPYLHLGKPGQRVRWTFQHSGHDVEAMLLPGEVMVSTDEEPTIAMDISEDGKSLVPHVHDLETQKLHMKHRVRELIMWSQNGGCDTAHGRIQTDFNSRIELQHSAAHASRHSDCKTVWKMMDNSMVELSAAETVEVARLVHERHQACFHQGQGYLAQIDAATNLDELAQVGHLKDHWPD